MKVILVLTITACVALPAIAGIEITYDTQADFGRFHTYGWKSGTEATRPEVQRWVVNAIERELEAKKLRAVTDRGADLYVVTHVFKEIDSQTRANYMHLDRLNVGVITSRVVATTRGVLIIDLIDGESERSVWRGMASDVMAPPSPKKLRKKIDKAARRLLRDFPPR